MARAHQRKRGASREKNSKKTPASAPVQTGPEVVSSARLSAVLGVGDRWLRELAEKGFLIKVGRAQYALEPSVQGYVRFIRETEVKGAQDAATSREAFESERARKLKLENDQAEAKLVDTQLAISAVDAVVGVFLSEVHSIPARVTQDIALRRKWEQDINRVIDGINERCRKAVSNLAAGRDPLDDAGDDDA